MRLINGCQNFFVKRSHKLLHNSSRAGHLAKYDCFGISYVTFGKSTSFSYICYFSIIDKTSSGPNEMTSRAVVWRPLVSFYDFTPPASHLAGWSHGENTLRTDASPGQMASSEPTNNVSSGMPENMTAEMRAGCRAVAHKSVSRYFNTVGN